MGQSDFLYYLRRRPFLPFRMFLTDGAFYDIRHPDQAIPTFTSVWITRPRPVLGGTGVDEVVIVSLLQVVRLEPIPSPTGNGN